MKKTWILSVLCMLTLCCCLFSCKKSTSTNANVKGTEDYPITISVFTTDTQQEPPADNRAYKWIKEKFNVEFTWDILVGEKDQKIGLMIASGDYPDLVNIESPKFIEAGAVIPLEGLIEQYAPNIKKHYASCWDKITEDDGHIYCLPNYGVIDNRWQSQHYNDSAMWLQKEVLKEFGYPKIQTMDEYFDIIERYVKKYPTIDGMPTIGFSILTYDWHDFCLCNPPNFLAGYPNDGNGCVDPVTKKYQVTWYMDCSKQWFKKLNEIDKKGLLDRACFTENYDQYIAKLSAGRVLGVHDQFWQFQSSDFALKTENKNNRTMCPLPIVLDKSIKPQYRNQPLPNLQRGYGISIKCKDPVRVIRFLDAQLEEENQRILQWGFEGVDYHLAADGTPYRTPEQRRNFEDETWKLKNLARLWIENAPKMEGSFSDGYATDFTQIPSEFAESAKPEDIELWKAYNVASYAELMDYNPPANQVWFPMWQIEPESGSEEDVALKKCKDLYAKYLPRVILCKTEEFESVWAEYCKALQDAGIGKYEAFMQKKLDERIAKWSK